MRPNRVYKTMKGRYYYLRKGKRVYIRRKKGAPKLSQKQVVRISIKNIIGDKSRRVRKKTKRKKLKYTQRIVKEQVERTAKNTGLPVYLFEPKKIIPSLSDRVSTKAKEESTSSSYDKLLKEIEKVKNLIKIPDNETKAKVPVTPVSDEPEKPKKYNKTLLKKLIKKKLDESTIDRPTVVDLKKEFNSADTTERIMKLFFEEYNVSLKDNTKYEQLYNVVFKEVPNNVFSILNDFIYTVIEGEDVIKRMKEKSKLPVLSPEEKTSIGQDDQQMPSEIEGSGNGDGEGGLYNDEIERINDKVFDSTIPVIAKNELETLDQYVKPNMKKFGFIINTDPIPQPQNSNGHWISVFINNTDDYQSIEFFDPLVSTPTKELIAKLKQITKKINPEQYFLFKINRLKTQPDESDNCGYHCILFLEKRFHNVPWSEATYYNDYINKTKPEHSSKGEGEVVKAKRKYKTFL